MDGTPSQPDPDTIKMFVGQVRYLPPLIMVAIIDNWRLLWVYDVFA